MAPRTTGGRCATGWTSSTARWPYRSGFPVPRMTAVMEGRDFHRPAYSVFGPVLAQPAGSLGRAADRHRRRHLPADVGWRRRGRAPIAVRGTARDEAEQDCRLGEAHADSSFEALSYLPGVEHGPGRYLGLISRAAETTGIPVIASLNGVSPGGWTDYASGVRETIFSSHCSESSHGTARARAAVTKGSRRRAVAGQSGQCPGEVTPGGPAGARRFQAPMSARESLSVSVRPCSINSSQTQRQVHKGHMLLGAEDISISGSG